VYEAYSYIYINSMQIRKKICAPSTIRGPSVSRRMNSNTAAIHVLVRSCVCVRVFSFVHACVGVHVVNEHEHNMTCDVF
jgi:hypothetical protein